jgi:hypothetical protein
VLPPGTTTISIGAEGNAEWRKLPASGQLTVTGAIWWCVYDADFQEKASGSGKGIATLSGSSASYLVVFGKAGASIRVDVTSNVATN